MLRSFPDEIIKLNTSIFVILVVIDHSPIRQSFKIENIISTATKSILNSIKL